MIELRLSDADVRLGHTVSGSVTWQTDRPPERVVARVGWVTEGRGDADEEYFGEESLELGTSEFGSLNRLDFALQVPSDAPVSYDGKILRIVWVVEARVFLPWAKDVVESAPFRVVA